MKYFYYLFFYGLLQMIYFIWNAKFYNYTLKEYIADVEDPKL